jgi:hypothetical protein
VFFKDLIEDNFTQNTLIEKYNVSYDNFLGLQTWLQKLLSPKCQPIIGHYIQNFYPTTSVEFHNLNEQFINSILTISFQKTQKGMTTNTPPYLIHFDPIMMTPNYSKQLPFATGKYVLSFVIINMTKRTFIDTLHYMFTFLNGFLKFYHRCVLIFSFFRFHLIRLIFCFFLAN